MDNLLTSIIVFTLGVLASLCIIIMAFSFNRSVILWSTLLTSVITGVQYILLEQTATTFLIGISLVYSILLMLENKLPAVRTHAFTGGVLTVQLLGYIAINGITLDWSILALAGTLIGTVALWFQNPVKLKVTMLVMGLIWLTFQIAAGAYGQLPGELVFLAGITFSLIMLAKAHKLGKPLTEVEELPAMLKRKLLSKAHAEVPAYN